MILFVFLCGPAGIDSIRFPMLPFKSGPCLFILESKMALLSLLQMGLIPGLFKTYFFWKLVFKELYGLQPEAVFGLTKPTALHF